MGFGLKPDLLICRTEHELGDDIRNKLSLFCNVDKECVIQAIDKSSIYAVPIELENENLDRTVLSKLSLPNMGASDMTAWHEFLTKLESPQFTVTIGLVGKYVELQDAYKSIHESFIHAGVSNHCKVNLVSIHSSDITTENVAEVLGSLDGVLVAPGFGDRGIEGKIIAIKYLRENNIPFFGICLGMQMAVIEYARNVLGMKDAHSTEMNKKTAYPVIDMMEDQKKIKKMGGTMRLGSYPCVLKEGSKAFEAYGQKDITERHRHRFEYNNKFQEQFEQGGLVSTGINADNNLVEIVEIPTHKWFVGVQFHPELKSTVLTPHPLFVAFIKACLDKS
jgi:CTP synthase